MNDSFHIDSFALNSNFTLSFGLKADLTKNLATFMCNYCMDCIWFFDLLASIERYVLILLTLYLFFLIPLGLYHASNFFVNNYLILICFFWSVNEGIYWSYSKGLGNLNSSDWHLQIFQRLTCHCGIFLK